MLYAKSCKCVKNTCGESLSKRSTLAAAPSQLAEEDFREVFETIRKYYGMEHCREITLEANPDDLTEEYTAMLQQLPFNRISMGIQTLTMPP